MRYQPADERSYVEGPTAGSFSDVSEAAGLTENSSLNRLAATARGSQYYQRQLWAGLKGVFPEAPSWGGLVLHTFLPVKMYLECPRFVLAHMLLPVCIAKYVKLDVLEPNPVPGAAAEPCRGLGLVCDW